MAEEARDFIEVTENDLKGDGTQDAGSLSMADVMARLSLSRAGVYRLVKDGVLTASKNDAQLVFRECDVATAAKDLGERRDKVADLLRQLAAKLADRGIDVDADECMQDVESGMGEVTRRLLLASMAARVSDVYVLPSEDGDRVLARVGGTLQELVSADRGLGSVLKEKLKAMAPLPDAESGEVSTAVFKHSDENQSAQVRMSVLSTLTGEQLHLRFFHFGVKCTLDSLGHTAKQREFLQRHLSEKSGLLVLAGSHDAIVRQYRLALAEFLAAKGKLVVSIDRAPNYQSENTVHLVENRGEGSDNSDIWRKAMSLGPDAILLDRIAERAEVGAMIAALAAGITVMVQVPTASSDSALRYLCELGLDRREITLYLLAVSEFMSVPQLCHRCRAPRALALGEAELLNAPATAQVYVARGCHQCEDGYRGSRAVWGLVTSDEAVYLVSDTRDTIQQETNTDYHSDDLSLDSAVRAAVLAGDVTIEHVIHYLR